MLRARVAHAIFLSLVLSVLPTIGLDSPASAADPPVALIEIDGAQFEALPGRTFTVGRRTAAGCSDVSYRVGLVLPNAIGYGRVDVDVSETCVLTVENVTFEAEGRLPDGTKQPVPSGDLSVRQSFFGPLGFVAQADTQRRIWSRHLMHEQFHVTTTLVLQDFTYWQSATSVYGPAPYDQYCWQDGLGWTIESCTAATVLSGPDTVQRYTKGMFVNSCCGGIRHNLGANPAAGIAGYSYWCDTVLYSMPFGWHDHCEGGRVW